MTVLRIPTPSLRGSCRPGPCRLGPPPPEYRGSQGEVRDSWNRHAICSNSSVAPKAGTGRLSTTGSRAASSGFGCGSSHRSNGASVPNSTPRMWSNRLWRRPSKASIPTPIGVLGPLTTGSGESSSGGSFTSVPTSRRKAATITGKSLSIPTWRIQP
jgi:hypothetical protein